MSSNVLDAPRLVGADQVAERYGVTSATVLAWARRGWIPRFRAGQNIVLFNIAEVDEALRQRGRIEGVPRGR